MLMCLTKHLPGHDLSMEKENWLLRRSHECIREISVYRVWRKTWAAPERKKGQPTTTKLPMMLHQHSTLLFVLTATENPSFAVLNAFRHHHHHHLVDPCTWVAAQS